MPLVLLIVSLLGCACAMQAQAGECHITATRPIAVERPLADPAITIASDGIWYLTGTVGTKQRDGTVDFTHNEGALLWRSTDGAAWEALGAVWTFAGQDRETYGWPFHEQVVGPTSLGHALTAPRLHQVGTQWVITFAKNHLHSGLLAAAKPEGPYRFVRANPREGGRDGNISVRAEYISLLSGMMTGDATLHQDAQGGLWWIWGSGFLAPLKADLKQQTAEPRLLTLTIPGWPNLPLETRDEDGASLHVHAGVHLLVFAATTASGRDTLVSRSERLEGPYSPPVVLIPGGGPARLFTDKQGLHAACMQDGRPAIVDLDLAKLGK